eukprot:SAG22_NODE_3744_length_1547_cov_1.741022_3_plen_65_part_01
MFNVDPAIVTGTRITNRSGHLQIYTSIIIQRITKVGDLVVGERQCSQRGQRGERGEVGDPVVVEI